MRKLILWMTAFLLMTSALAEPSLTFFAMDTVMTITADADEAVLKDAETQVEALDALLSVTDPNSEIYALNRDGTAPVSADTEALLRFGIELGGRTGGALDITLYPVVRAWGFTTGEYRIPSAGELAELLPLVDYSSIVLKDGTASLPEGAMVDLGSIAKGYASDKVVELLRKAGLRSALVDLGGNIWCLGAKPDGSSWHIGVRSPDGDGYCAVLAVQDRALVTSGSYERCFTDEQGHVYGHIFDPANGRPAESGLKSVTVVGGSGLLCDGLSTALYVMGPDAAEAWLLGQDEVEAVLIDGEGFRVTAGLRDSFFPYGSYQGAVVRWIG